MTPATCPRRRLARWLTVLLIVLWLGAFVATHMPASDVPSTGMSDKELHLIGFLVLGSLVLLNLSSRAVRRAWRIPLTLAVLAAYAALDELTQPLAGRSCEGADWLADVTGTLAAVAAWELLLLIARRTRWAAKLTGQQDTAGS